MKIVPSKDDWDRIVSLGIPLGMTEEGYAKAVAEGELAARQFLNSGLVDPKNLTFSQVKALNRYYMGAVHTWAAQFRQPGIVKTEDGDGIGWGNLNWQPCPWNEVPKKVKTAQTRLEERTLTASPLETWKAIVEHHVEFLEAHPFFDGNKRLSRLMTESLVESHFGPIPSLAWGEDHTFHLVQAVVKKTQLDRVSRKEPHSHITQEAHKEAAAEYQSALSLFRTNLEKNNPSLYARIHDQEDERVSAETLRENERQTKNATLSGAKEEKAEVKKETTAELERKRVETVKRKKTNSEKP